MKTVLAALVLSSLLVTDVGAVQLGLPSAGSLDGLSLNCSFWDGTNGPVGSQPNTGFDMIQATGCKFVRMALPWDGVESTKGQYDFSPQDPLYAACAARGIRVIWQLFLADPTTYNLYGTDPGSAAWRQGFANFAAATAAHYKGTGSVYEMWNEPDGAGFWPGGSPSVSQYMAMVQQAVPAMRGGYHQGGLHDRGARLRRVRLLLDPKAAFKGVCSILWTQ